ncbi:MAG: DUF4129 domain-containing protein [Verrucomicrobiae bacterium]|nr:DUF4129 domain-containing protein [Verrucomicrobiae bacterium]
MAGRVKNIEDVGVWQLLEQALHLLRLLPPSAWAAYAAGAIPFALGLLFFWGEMSQSALAERHLRSAALGMALLFLWLKAWQSVFCERLLALQGGLAPEKYSLRRLARMTTLQAAVQPWAFLVLPVALAAALPFAWAWAFFQNFTVLARGQEPSLRANLDHAWQCARWAPRQNHYLLSLLSLAALLVFLNWISAFALIPFLLKAWLGIDSWFTRSPEAYQNLTFFAIMGVLTWLTLDPLMKAAYALRCFYAQARSSGEDLKAELRRLRRLALPLFLLGLSLLSLPAHASPSPPPPPPALPATQLDQALDRTLQQREFVWRLPREQMPKTATQNSGLLSAFFDEIADSIRSWWEGVSITLDKLDRWLDQLLGRRRLPTFSPTPDGTQTDWASPLRLILALLLAAMLVILIRWLWRRHRQRAAALPTTSAASAAPSPPPDLRKEEVSPALLPEEEWLALARDLTARGEWRLALRALYLSALAGLARRELLALARGKSNREYARELARRAHQYPALPPLFHELMLDFERVWYGCHPATPDLYHACEDKLARLQNT